MDLCNLSVIKSLMANACFCLVLALPFFFFGKTIFSLLPNGNLYSTYWWSIPWLIGISYLTSIIMLFITTEFSANRFAFLKWYLPLDLAYPILLLLVSGHGYLASIIPASWTSFLTTHNIYTLDAMLWWMTAINTIKAVICIVAMPIKHSRDS